MTTYTPGPWDDETGPLLGSDGTQVGEPMPGADLVAQLPRIRADRALIRAAPDMLAALRIALDHMQASIETCRRAPGDIAMVRAAIAKATGA